MNRTISIWRTIVQNKLFLSLLAFLNLFHKSNSFQNFSVCNSFSGRFALISKFVFGSNNVSLYFLIFHNGPKLSILIYLFLRIICIYLQSFSICLIKPLSLSNFNSSLIFFIKATLNLFWYKLPEYKK